MSSAQTRLPLSPSGTSPATIRWARPSTIAVFPTPGSPISTGLFFVRRESTWITRRISSSRPMTGSSLPCSASSVRSRPNFSSAWYVPSGSCDVTRWPPRTSFSLREQLVARHDVEREQQVLGRDELVLELAHLLLGAVEDAGERGRRARLLRRALERGQPREIGLGLGPHLGRLFAEQRLRQLLVEEREQQVRPGRSPGCRGGARAPARRRSPPAI